MDKYELVECESDEIYENDKLFNFSSNIIINKETEQRDFKIRGWPFLTIVKILF